MKNLLLANPFFKAPVLYFDHLESTMDTALEYAAKGYPSGSVFMAGYQSKGRCRGKDRIWEAESESSILSTLLLKTGDCTVPAHQIPVRTGLAVSDWLTEEWKLDVQIKWPNDVLVDGKKICGILCEASGGWTRIGFGINLNQELLPEFANKGIQATSVKIETGNHANPQESLEKFLHYLYDELIGEEQDTDLWIGRVNTRLYKRNEVVKIRKGPPDQQLVTVAVITGINSDGALMIRESGQTETPLYSGEILYRF